MNGINAFPDGLKLGESVVNTIVTLLLDPQIMIKEANKATKEELEQLSNALKGAAAAIDTTIKFDME